MIRWRQALLDGIFVATEAIVWFMGLRIVATGAERAYLSDLERRLQTGVSEGAVDSVAAESALSVVRAGMDASAGPSVLLVIGVALAAFLLMRGIMRSGVEPAVAAGVLLFGSIAGLNVVLHLAISGDLRIWDVSGFVGFLSDPSPYFAPGLDLPAFVRDPDIGGAHGGTLAVVFSGLTSMWLRFLVAARGTVTFERVLRSFTIGFLAALVLVTGGALAGYGGLARYVVPQFVLGALGLAVANHARATPTEGERRETPWATAVVGTLGTLLAAALLVGLAVVFNVGAGLEVAGTLALRGVGAVMVVVVTPFFWLMDAILNALIPDSANNNVLQRVFDFELIPEDAERPESDGLNIPRALGNLARFGAVVALGWVAYRAAVLLFGRRGRSRELVEAEAGTASGAPAGFRELLRDLFPGRRASTGAEWVQAQPIYQLFARTVRDADDRGLRRLPGETPAEFGEVAARILEGPALAMVGSAFDRARYGRHFPARAEVAALEQDVAAWEQAQPATEALRERVAGARHISRDDAFALKIQLAKRQDQSTADRMGPTLDDF